MSKITHKELGLKPPEWLTTSETYGFRNVPWKYIKANKWRFITHTPENKEYLMTLRSNGMRGFPYMTFYQDKITREFQGFRLSDHTDWIEIDKNGHWKRTGFWESEDLKNMYCTCANVKGFRNAVLEHIEYLMDLGAGGIFLDNVHINRKCWGEKYGIHKHLYATQIESFAILLREAQALIRSKDPDGALLINSADPVTLPRRYWPWIDCEMSESYICTWVSKERRGDWDTQWNGMDRKLAKWARAGKQVCCLSYVGYTENKLKDDCYFCYSSARLMNFIWQAGSIEVYDDPECNILYQIRTGQPHTKEIVTDRGIHYRIFENGIVAVNASDISKALEVEYSWPTSKLLDLYYDTDIQIRWGRGKKGKVKLHIPARSGRVYLYEPETVTKDSRRNELELTIETKPPLGKVRFRVDDIPLWTHSGRWKIKYEKGANYGKCTIGFDKVSTHRIEVVDLEKRALLVTSGYVEAYRIDEQAESESEALQPGESPRLGKLMDPSNPTELFEGAAYRFVGWEGDIKGKEPVIHTKVGRPTRLIAKYRKIK